MARLIFLRWWAIFWGYQICLGRSVVKFQPLPKVLCDGTDRVTRLIEGWNSTTNLFNGTILCWGWEEGTREGVGWKHDHTTTTDGYGWRWLWGLVVTGYPRPHLWIQIAHPERRRRCWDGRKGARIKGYAVHSDIRDKWNEWLAFPHGTGWDTYPILDGTLWWEKLRYNN